MTDMRHLEGPEQIRRALRLVGERLAAERVEIRIVLIGGAAMNLRGFVSRATADVDIIAVAREGAAGLELHRPPEPLHPTPAELAVAREWIVAQDPTPAFADLLDQVVKEIDHETR